MFKIVNRKKFATSLIVLVVVIAGIIILFSSGTIKKTESVTIKPGQSANEIWAQIEDQGITSGTILWKWHALKLGAADGIQAGTYQLERGEKIKDVIKRMLAGETVPDELTITYPEGFTLQQMAARTAARGIGTEEEFITAATPENFSDQFSFLKDVPPDRTLEGYLFPDTYRVFADDKPEDVIQRMLGNFDNKITADLLDRRTGEDRTLDDKIIMASIVEREVVNDDDMAMVSGILWSRVDNESGLGADATVRYALNQWDDPLTVEDLDIDSPYNTRRYKGLPPGPISNPGLRAITASVHPQESDFYYYLSTPEGETIFSKTNDEHNRNKAEHLQ